jgi:N6-adenosine-specific RNA methylase IME4
VPKKRKAKAASGGPPAVEVKQLFPANVDARPATQPTLPARLASELAKASGVSLNLKDGLPLKRWGEIGQQLAAMGRGVQWWIGDWWAFGEHTYRERAEVVASGIFGRSFGGLMNLGSVSRAFAETSRRREVLSFNHHAEVAGLKCAKKQDYLLAKAEHEGWSSSDLRAQVAVLRHGERLEKLEEISMANGPLPTGRRFPVILADPPWRYDFAPAFDNERAVERHYPTMALEDICALPVSEIAADDALLLLWATGPKLREAVMEVIPAWGFTYRTNFAWVKDKIGTGYWVRAQHELLLIATRGDFPAPLPGTQSPSVIYAPRGEHSAKPEAVYELVERAYPSLGKIELFARQKRDGWAAWGNQAMAAE